MCARIEQVRPRVGRQLRGLVDEVEQVQVGDAVAWLHGGEHPELGEPRDVGRLDELSMLDAVAHWPIELLLCGPRDVAQPVEDFEHMVVRLVADGVDGHGDARLGGDVRLLEEFVLGHLRDAEVLGLAVGFGER